ncbi:hypothetical protein HF086_002949 [Spodoptera exigua]|uniref:Uncharacterized protein n=1 Tax=Spodoptera exigua TaxID=7107 RepID=A0A922MNV6_SPOEX|nr:hypothetical protein HF086_002949 [Spodoptera exigua]
MKPQVPLVPLSCRQQQNAICRRRLRSALRVHCIVWRVSVNEASGSEECGSNSLAFDKVSKQTSVKSYKTQSSVVSVAACCSDLLQNPLLVPLKQLRGGARAADLLVLDLRWHPTQPWLLAACADGTLRLYA